MGTDSSCTAATSGGGPARDDGGPVEEVLAQVKPRLRGWLHVAMAPLALLAGIVLVGARPDSTGRVGGAVFLAASVLLFGTSAIYHRCTWGARGEAVLRRMDHANIYVFIAATLHPDGPDDARRARRGWCC